MVERRGPYRIALAVKTPVGYIHSAMLGVLDYLEKIDHWELIGRGSYPFVSFKDLDVTAIDGVIGHVFPPATQGKLREAGVTAVTFAGGNEKSSLLRVGNDDVSIEGDRVTVGASKNLPALINELATHGLDLSPLTGILGTVGGAVYGWRA